MGDITIVATPTPDLSTFPLNATNPQGSQSNALYLFDIDPVGNSSGANLLNLTVFVTGNVDTSNLTFELFRYQFGSWTLTNLI